MASLFSKNAVQRMTSPSISSSNTSNSDTATTTSSTALITTATTNNTQLQLIDSAKDAQLALAKPSIEATLQLQQETLNAINSIVEKKTNLKSATSVQLPSNEVNYIRYTPYQSSATSQRIIQLQEKPVDPVAPHLFRIKKLPNMNTEAPVPILHSPPRKITVEEQNAWKIPACVSSWKNRKGYVIPLDKRLVNQGLRQGSDVVINERFGDLAESLSLAEKHAREEVEQRTAVLKDIKHQEQEKKEEEIRRMVLAARSRAAALASSTYTKEDDRNIKHEEEKNGNKEFAPSVVDTLRAGVKRARGFARSSSFQNDDAQSEDEMPPLTSVRRLDS